MVGEVARVARDSGNMGFLVNYRTHWTQTVNSIRFFPPLSFFSSLFLPLFLSHSLSLSILGFATRIPDFSSDVIFERVEKFTGFVDVYYIPKMGTGIMERKGSSITIKSSIFIISGYTGVTGIRKKEKICGRGVEG